MIRRDRFRHDVSRYERPSLGWRCGRAVAFFGRPCRNGPSADGRCGGTAECTPAQRGGTWTCGRSEAEGGRCGVGPDDKGRCRQTRPPCAPRPSLARWRARLSLLALGTVAATIAVFFAGLDRQPRALSSIDPGPLSAAHAQFSGAAGCAACHDAHGKGAGAWWQALFGSAAGAGTPRALAVACLDCHGFGGKETLAHNRAFDRSPSVRRTDCLMCHTEHRGEEALVATISALQCRACHKKDVRDFARNHPPFPEGFPHDHPRGIRFDHSSHLNRHFADPRVAPKVPKGGCVGCHEVASAGRAIRPAGFEAACAGCHADSVSGRDLVVLRWPELEETGIGTDEVEAACGVSGETARALREQVEKARQGEKPPPATAAEAYTAVSADRPNAVMAYLLGISSDDPKTYGAPVEALAKAMIESGAEPLLALARKHAGKAPVEPLFQGLAPETLRMAACAWAANQEYPAPGKPMGPGWRADGLELRYAKPRHADPVLKAWVEWAAMAPAAADAGAGARLAALRKELLAPAAGAGLCGKCHVGTDPANPLAVRWDYRFGTERHNTRFNHRPHVDLLGPEKTCTACHALAKSQAAGAAPAATSTASGAAPKGAFEPIVRESCVACHAPAKVRADCQLCHVYHNDHALKKGMMSDAK